MPIMYKTLRVIKSNGLIELQLILKVIFLVSLKFDFLKLDPIKKSDRRIVVVVANNGKVSPPAGKSKDKLIK